MAAEPIAIAPDEEWIWEDAIYPSAWLGMLAGAKLAWESLSRVVCCQSAALGGMGRRGKLAAQYHVYNASTVLIRQVFAGSAPESVHTQAPGLDAQGMDQLGTHRRTRFLWCNAATGAVSESYPKPPKNGQGVHLPPNLTVYRQEGGAQLPPGRYLYFLYGGAMSPRALLNLVAAERELNAGVVAHSAWPSFVRAKLAGMRRSYGLLEAWRWWQAYELYLDGEATLGLRFIDLLRM